MATPGGLGVSGWWDKGACKGVDQAVFFPPDGGSADDLYAAGKELCARCFVRDECLDDALSRKDQWGLWGGMTPDERKRLLRAQQKVAGL